MVDLIFNNEQKDSGNEHESLNFAEARIPFKYEDTFYVWKPALFKHRVLTREKHLYRRTKRVDVCFGNVQILRF